MSDPINPAHYQGFSNGAQVIDIVENLPYNRGAAIKYLARAGRKDPAKHAEDLKKSAWYVQREIERIERGMFLDSSTHHKRTRIMTTVNPITSRK